MIPQLRKCILLHLIIFLSATSIAQNNSIGNQQLTPIMGWSSWNHFRTHINEKIIKAQANVMASLLKDAGYNFINIDDGFFEGRDAQGTIRANTAKFPSGMKALAQYIHSKNLKAGIYSDAGINTCASYWDKDTAGVGMGLFGHEEQDLKLMLQDWNYDFIKVDWCGAEKLALNEQQQYTRIGQLIEAIRPGTVYNVCRWQFPGTWVTLVADSWRISGDITNSFSSILQIIDLNAELWKYAGPGHVNDMDMLQVGRGMSNEEDKTHFSMWSLMCSPLLLGNDLTTMSRETLDIITNKEIIALNQDALVYQARRIKDFGETEIWAKPLQHTMSGKVAVGLLNRTNQKTTMVLNVAAVSIDFQKGYTYRNLWLHKTFPASTTQELSFEVPPHGIVVLLLQGTATPFNIFQANERF